MNMFWATNRFRYCYQKVMCMPVDRRKWLQEDMPIWSLKWAQKSMTHFKTLALKTHTSFLLEEFLLLAELLLNLNAHCRTVFSLSDKKVAYLMRQYHPVHPLKVLSTQKTQSLSWSLAIMNPNMCSSLKILLDIWQNHNSIPQIFHCHNSYSFVLAVS